MNFRPLVAPNSDHASKQPPWVVLHYKKKDNVVHLKTSFQCKVLLMCTIIVFALRQFEVSGPVYTFNTFTSGILSSSSATSLTAFADVSGWKRGREAGS